MLFSFLRHDKTRSHRIHTHEATATSVLLLNRINISRSISSGSCANGVETSLVSLLLPSPTSSSCTSSIFAVFPLRRLLAIRASLMSFARCFLSLNFNVGMVPQPQLLYRGPCFNLAFLSRFNENQLSDHTQETSNRFCSLYSTSRGILFLHTHFGHCVR